MSAAPPPPRPTGPPKSRIPVYLGVAAAAAAGYYFYLAGGDPNTARKEAQHDARQFSSEAQRRSEEGLARGVQEGKDRIDQGAHKLRTEGENAKANAMGKVDQADQKIGQEAAKAKGGIMGWFGK